MTTKRLAAKALVTSSEVLANLVPELQRFPQRDTFRAFTIPSTPLGFDSYDIAKRGLVSHHYWVVDGKLETFSSPFHYVWPSELDLMVRLAGMRLSESRSDWSRRTLRAKAGSTSQSGRSVRRDLAVKNF